MAEGASENMHSTCQDGRRTVETPNIQNNLKALHLSEKSTANATSPLLKLAPELRNRIYETALVEHRTIDIRRDHIVTPPALLATCKQIRAEAISIYFVNNRFRVSVRNCDGTLLLKWRHHMRKYMRDSQGEYAQMDIGLSGTPSWSNLLIWLKLAYEEGCGAALQEQKDKSGGDMHKVVVSTHRIVARAEKVGRAWEQVEEDLNDFHDAIVAFSPKWK